MDITLHPDELPQLLEHPLLRGLLELSSDGVVVIAADTRQIMAMNGRARDLLGIVGDPIARRCSDTLDSPACQAGCPLTRAVRGEPRQQLRTLFFRRQDDGDVVHADARMLVVRDPQGHALAGIELLSDRRELHRLERALRSRQSVLGMVGRSAVMQGVYDGIERLGPCDTPVLVCGPPGSGKRRAAEALHAASARRDKPVVVATLDSLPQAARAAAIAACVQDAAGGTAVLANVDGLDGGLALGLAQLIQGGRCSWPGGQLVIDQTRLVFTAQQVPQPLQAVLRASTLSMPGLDRRLDDLELLVNDLLAAAPGSVSIDAPALAALAHRSWPGNVGQLAAVVASAVVRAGPEGCIGLQHITRPQLLGEGTSVQAARVLADPLGGRVHSLAHAEQAAIRQALVETAGNMSAAARLLGIDRSTLWRKLKRLESGLAPT